MADVCAGVGAMVGELSTLSERGMLALLFL